VLTDAKECKGLQKAERDNGHAGNDLQRSASICKSSDRTAKPLFGGSNPPGAFGRSSHTSPGGPAGRRAVHPPPPMRTGGQATIPPPWSWPVVDLHIKAAQCSIVRAALDRCMRLSGSEGLATEFGNGEVPADLVDESFGDLCVARNRLDSAGVRVGPKGMAASFTFQITPVPTQVPEQCARFTRA
jgi:hypothetical protein